MSCYQENWGNSRTDYLYQSPIKQLIHLGLQSSSASVSSCPVSNCQEIIDGTLWLYMFPSDNSPPRTVPGVTSGHNYSVTVNVNQVRPCRQWREIPPAPLSSALCPVSTLQPQQAAASLRSILIKITVLYLKIFCRGLVWSSVGRLTTLTCHNSKEQKTLRHAALLCF